MTDVGDPRFLREMTREAALDRVPDLAWDQVEARLFAELDDSADPPPRESFLPGEGRSSTTPVQACPAQSVLPAPRTIISASEPETAVDPAPLAAASKSARRPRWTSWVGSIAVAAAAALLWISHGSSTPGAEVPVAVAEPIDVDAIPMAPGLSGSRDLSVLKSGDVVEADIGPLAFGNVDQIEWTLAAGSRLVVRKELGSGAHVVELEAGSMRGSVASTASTPLVITAGETEVVSLGPGAVFNVTRSSRRLVMHLEQGSASVGPRGHLFGGDWLEPYRLPIQLSPGGPTSGDPTSGHPTSGRSFQAPVAASFSLDGGSTFEVLPPTAANEPIEAPRMSPTSDDSVISDEPHVTPTEDPVALLPTDDARVMPRHPSAPNVAPVPSPTAKAPLATNETAPTSPASSLAPSEGTDGKDGASTSDSKAASTVVACISRVRDQRQANAAEGVRILVSSTLRVQIADDGSVKSAVFQPPLEPELQSCAVSLLRAKLQPGSRVLSIPVNVK